MFWNFSPLEIQPRNSMGDLSVADIGTGFYSMCQMLPSVCIIAYKAHRLLYCFTASMSRLGGVPQLSFKVAGVP